MSPDRHDDQHDDTDEHGVLDDAGNLETAGIGIIDTATAQVRLVLPALHEDDSVEDDVIVDEVPLEGGFAGSDDGTDAEDDAADDDVADDAVADYDEVATDDIILEDHEDHAHAEILSTEGVEDAVVEDDLADADTETTDARDAVDTPAPASVESAPAEPEPTSSNASTASSVPVGAPAPLTGSIPTTRREAHQGSALARTDRVHQAERVHPPQSEPALVSKRLGELADTRESADLLTADRLLDRAQLSGAEPEGLWQQLVYSLSRHRINLGDSRKARARKDLDRRIAAPLPGGARFVPVLSRKGGVGKTTITTLLGMALAAARDDRVIAVDANPDRGTLADRIGRPSGRTVRDLARTRAEVTGFNDISTIVARDVTRLDVLASDADPRVSEAFSDVDYHDVAALAAHYYSIVLTDTGTGIVHSVMGATLELADQLVIVAGLSIDEARLASETLTWLETNGYADIVKNAVVVLNNSRPGMPLVRENELEAHFRSRVRAVIRMPYDPLIGTGSAISFRDLQPATRTAARELAAAVVEGLRALAPAA